MRMGIFARLLDLLFPRKDTALIVERITDIEFGKLVSPVVTESGVVALLPYRHPHVRACVIEAKFHRNAKAISLLANVLKEYVAALEEDSEAFDTLSYMVVPIPLSAARQRERGYNQVEEVVRSAGLSYETALLKRIRDTRPQTSLPRSARIENVKDAFALAHEPSPARTYILVDDVFTTGATLASAARSMEGTPCVRLALAH